MKRKSNIFLMWAVFIALFTIMPQVKAAEGVKADSVPKNIAIRWVKDGVSTAVTTTPSEFVESIHEYNATIPFRADSVYLGIKWEKSEMLGVLTGGTGKLPVTVMDGNKRIFADKEYRGSYDSSYVVGPIGNEGLVDGLFSYKIGNETYEYKLTVKRQAALTVSTLGRLYALSSYTSHPDTLNKRLEKADSLSFLRPDSEAKPDSVFFEWLNIEGQPVVPSGGDTVYVAKDSIDATDSITLFLFASDRNSRIMVNQSSKEITKHGKSFHNGFEGWKIEPNVPVQIKVTAEDGETESEYWVVIYSRPAVIDQTSKDTLKLVDPPMLKNLWLVDAKNEGKHYRLPNDSLHWHTNAYATEDAQKKLNDVIVIPSGVEYKLKYEWYSEKFKAEGKTDKDSLMHLGTVDHRTYTKLDTTYIEVKVLDLQNRERLKYTIKLRHPDLSLKDLVLNSGTTDTKPLAFTPSFHADSLTYRAKLKYDFSDRAVFVSLKVARPSAIDTVGMGEGRVIGVKHLSSTEDGLYKFSVEVKDAKDGKRAYAFKVKDGSVEKTYKVVIEKAWDLRLKTLTLKDDKTFVHPVELKDDQYDYPVFLPANVEIENMTVVATTHDVDYVKYTDGMVIDGDNSYIRIKTYDAGRDYNLTYKVKLQHLSSDATLKFLSVTPGGELSPAFNPNTEDYEVRVPEGQEFVFIAAVPSTEGATIEGNTQYPLTSNDMTFTVSVTANDKETKKEYRIRVIRGDNTGIQLPGASSAQVYAAGRTLHVITPSAERVAILSVDGKLLYSLDKPAGKVSVPGLPKGVLVIKGSSGWVKKAVI